MQLIIYDSGWPYYPMSIPGASNWRMFPFGIEVRDLYQSIFGNYYFIAYTSFPFYPLFLLMIGLNIAKKKMASNLD